MLSSKRLSCCSLNFMDTGKTEHNENNINKSSKAAAALRIATAVGVVAGGAVGVVSRNSTEAAPEETSWGARTEQSQQIDSTATPEASPTPKWTASSVSATPSPETPTVTPAEPSPTPKWTASSVLATPSPETSASLPQAGGEPARDNQVGVKNKLFIALSAVLAGIGIGTANKASKQRSAQK